jgi:hypothetical protein
MACENNFKNIAETLGLKVHEQHGDGNKEKKT